MYVYSIVDQNKFSNIIFILILLDVSVTVIPLGKKKKVCVCECVYVCECVFPHLLCPSAKQEAIEQSFKLHFINNNV